MHNIYFGTLILKLELELKNKLFNKKAGSLLIVPKTFVFGTQSKRRCYGNKYKNT